MVQKALSKGMKSNIGKKKSGGKKRKERIAGPKVGGDILLPMRILMSIFYIFSAHFLWPPLRIVCFSTQECEKSGSVQSQSLGRQGVTGNPPCDRTSMILISYLNVHSERRASAGGNQSH